MAVFLCCSASLMRLSAPSGHDRGIDRRQQSEYEKQEEASNLVQDPSPHSPSLTRPHPLPSTAPQQGH